MIQLFQLARNTELINLLLDCGANPNQQTIEGYTPLSASVLRHLQQKERSSWKTTLSKRPAHLVHCSRVPLCGQVSKEVPVKNWWHRAELVWRLKTTAMYMKEVEKKEAWKTLKDSKLPLTVDLTKRNAGEDYLSKNENKLPIREGSSCFSSKKSNSRIITDLAFF